MVLNDLMPMLTVKEVANLLHVHVNTLRRWSDQGILRSYRITRRGDRRYRQEDIDYFLAGYNDFNIKNPEGEQLSQTEDIG
jgi:excisionase family DNA binding protein